jgi:hypothetical protein
MKKVTKNIRIINDQEEYTIQLKKKCKWCWLLLLLLLPLLLLINVDEFVNYQVISKCPIEKKDSILIRVSFNESDKTQKFLVKSIDEKREAKFNLGKQKLYQLYLNRKSINKRLVKAEVIIAGKVVKYHEELYNNIRNTTTILDISPKNVFEVIVVSKKNATHRIENATVKIQYWDKEKLVDFSAQSNFMGLCKFNIPNCIDKIKTFGSKAGYFSDSIFTNYSSAILNQNERTLKLEPLIFSLDIVMCIDATSSMSDIIETVKSKSKMFYEELKETMIEYDKYTDIIRIKTIVFKSNCPDINWLVEGEFCEIPMEADKYNKQVETITATGGYETGLEAISLAFTSNFLHERKNLRQIIVVISDDNPVELNNGCNQFNGRLPINYSDLTKKWVKLNPNARLVLMVPQSAKRWRNTVKSWKNVIPIYNTGRINKSDYSRALKEIAKAI